MTQIESTVTSLHREAEAQFRPELEKIVSGIETGFRGTALYATENIAGRINARLEDEGFTVKIQFSGSQPVTDPARGKNKSECAYGGKNGDRHPCAVGRVAYGEPFVDGLAPVTWAGKTMTRM